jgi:hypothetical protein
VDGFDRDRLSNNQSFGYTERITACQWPLHINGVVRDLSARSARRTAAQAGEA